MTDPNLTASLDATIQAHLKALQAILEARATLVRVEATKSLYEANRAYLSDLTRVHRHPQTLIEKRRLYRESKK